MKSIILPAVVVFGAWFSFSTAVQKNKVEHVAVVELFTSQGCSSCPSADKFLAELGKREDVLALSFHVSYWNYLGWKDPYSSEEFTNRQRTYARKMNLSSVYTPQMIVNGKDEFVGSNKAKAEAAIASASISQDVELTVSKKSSSSLQIKYNLSGPLADKILNIALVERHVQNEVPRGENRGKLLEHTNVVSVFKSIEAKKAGNFDIELPAHFKLSNGEIIAYIQDENTLEITGGSKVDL
ncbi:MAG: DUF1223 domain-containing protein [Cyclobacteriaceae bacterium]|nr:DUF1223 domain-containing protein [Cyclobacteriaceae bacterium]